MYGINKFLILFIFFYEMVKRKICSANTLFSFLAIFMSKKKTKTLSKAGSEVKINGEHTKSKVYLRVLIVVRY